MKSTALIIALLCLLCIPLPATAGGEMGTLHVGENFPTFRGTTIDGYQFNLDDYLYGENYVFVDFWATWCGPCVSEIPNVVDAWYDYGPYELMVVGINLDDPSDMLKLYGFMLDKSITFPVINDFSGMGESLADRLNIDYIPQNFLLAQDGAVLFKDLRGDSLKYAIEALFEKGDPRLPIHIRITLDDDPRGVEDFQIIQRADTSQLTNPWAKPLNKPPKSVKLNIRVYNREVEDFDAVLRYSKSHLTGRKTNMIVDKETGDVKLSPKNGEPYVLWEVQYDYFDVVLHGEKNAIDTQFAIPLDDYAADLQWELHVPSLIIGDDFVRSGRIDFACLNTITAKQIEEQGGIVLLNNEPEPAPEEIKEAETEPEEVQPEEKPEKKEGQQEIPPGVEVSED